MNSIRVTVDLLGGEALGIYKLFELYFPQLS